MKLTGTHQLLLLRQDFVAFMEVEQLLANVFVPDPDTNIQLCLDRLNLFHYLLHRFVELLLMAKRELRQGLSKRS